MSAMDRWATGKRRRRANGSAAVGQWRRLSFERDRLSAEQSARIPTNAFVEVDELGRAFLCVGTDRLVFAGTLARLLDTLGLTERMMNDDAEPLRAKLG